VKRRQLVDSAVTRATFLDNAYDVVRRVGWAAARGSMLARAAMDNAQNSAFARMKNRAGPKPKIKVLLLLDGDPRFGRAPEAKFGMFVDELRRYVELVGIEDLTLRGPRRVAAVIAAWRPERAAWREHFRKNPLTFAFRSSQIQRRVQQRAIAPDVVLQIGALSKPPHIAGVPYALYLDFTSELTAREWPARMPMTRVERVLWRRQETSMYAGAAAIFCRSRHTARSVMSDYRITDTRVHVIGAGVNISLPDLTTRVDEGPRVLFIGTDFRRKGGDVLLNAWPHVVRAVPEATLMMIGPVPDRLPPRVETNAGTWDREAVMRELRRASVFVMPSRCETWGDVFIEAMAFGVPCIGSTMDAMPEIIQDGVTGFVVPPDNALALAGRIITLLTEPERASLLSAAARRRVEERFLWSQVIERMLPVLERVVGKPDGSAVSER
jgi:alpha-maltose-1-phosphate synthase